MELGAEFSAPRPSRHSLLKADPGRCSWSLTIQGAHGAELGPSQPTGRTVLSLLREEGGNPGQVLPLGSGSESLEGPRWPVSVRPTAEALAGVASTHATSLGRLVSSMTFFRLLKSLFSL